VSGTDEGLAPGGSIPSWLDTPPDAAWPDPDDPEPNPFVRYRRLLWSWQRAMLAGWTDDDVVALVRRLDASVTRVEGVGFRITPVGSWVDLDDRLPRRVLWKDETGNVAGSHKARHLMGLLLHLAVDAVADDTPLAISSCGNAALGAATVARAAGRPIDVFIPTWADPAIVARLEQLDARVHVCARSDSELGDPCMAAFREAVRAGARGFGVQATENRWTLDGGRTIGWELSEQMRDDPVEHVFVQVGGGALLVSCALGLLEGATLGPLPEAPAVWAVQTEGCAPFDRAWRALPQGDSIDQRLESANAHPELMTPWADPRSSATGILDDVTYDWLGVTRALLRTGGSSVVVPETDIVEATRLVKALGIDASATGAAGVAGVMTAMATGRIVAETPVAVLVTGRRR
jgi:threonine synthase